MKVTKDDIRQWLEEGQEAGATHVVIRSDGFSHDYYPCKCFSADEARQKAAETGNMQRTVEVYNLAEDWDTQLDTRRNFRY